MKSTFLRISTFLALFSIFYMNSSWADDTKPDPRANDACIDKESGDVCDFLNVNGDPINGKCQNPNAEGKLTCVPLN